MVGFGDHLHKEQTSDYDGQYLDYDMLKRCFPGLVEVQGIGKDIWKGGIQLPSVRGGGLRGQL